MLQVVCNNLSPNEKVSRLAFSLPFLFLECTSVSCIPGGNVSVSYGQKNLLMDKTHLAIAEFEILALNASRETCESEDNEIWLVPQKKKANATFSCPTYLLVE